MNVGDISLVICTRDRPEALRACLGSISDSLLLPGEVWVIDQSGDELTHQVVDEFTPNSPLNLRYYRHNGIGHTSARNIGAKISQGRIIAYTDDDCIVDESWTSDIIKEFEKSSVNCVCGRTIAANHKERPKLALISTLNPHTRRVVRKRCNPLLVGRGNNIAFRRSDLLAIGGFNEKIGVGTPVYAGDDADIIYRLVQAGGTIIVTPDAVVRHTQPNRWQMVTQKKRGYAISFAAIFSIKAVQGDVYAGMLLSGKLLYEAIYLLLGGILTMRRHMAQVGWHSLIGSLSGMKFLFNRDFRAEMHRLGITAYKANLNRATNDVPLE